MYEIGLSMIAATGCLLAAYLVYSGVEDWKKSRNARRALEEANINALEAVLMAKDEVRLARQLIEREK